MAGVDATLEFMQDVDTGFIFTNLVDFDMLYGHRNNPRGYADALEEFDARVPELLDALHPGDVLMFTADHGNDPTTPSTDHSRERVPFIAVGHEVRSNLNLGDRDSFADVAATIAQLLSLPEWRGYGTSFATQLIADI